MKQLLAELFEKHYQDVYGYLYSLCRDAALSEDLASEVFLEAVKSIAAFRGESDIRTWLFSIARHRWYTYLRREKRRIPTMSIHSLFERDMPAAEDSSGELAQLLGQILSGESTLSRDVVQMRIDGYSYYEIGKKLGIAENSARVIFFRAKAKIKKELEKEGFCCE